MSKAKPIFKILNKMESLEGREGLVYARVSSKRQETNGSGLQSQEGRCLSELRNLKVPHIKTFFDSFTGKGDFMNRPAMRDLLSYIDSHPNKKFIVIFDDLSRLARDVFFYFKLKYEFESKGVILKCLNYQFDGTDEGWYSELIFSGKAELDRKQNLRQVFQKQKSRLELGHWAFASKKGYTMTKSAEYGPTPMINKEGEILKEALEKFASGIYPRKIDACRFLVEQGFWSKQKPERYIDKFTAILEDPFYAGYIECLAWDVSRRVGKHKGLISLETFEIIQNRLGKFDLGKNIRKDISDDFPLRGLLVCADCGKHLTAAWSKGRNKKHPYYFCQNDSCESDSKVIRRDLIEDGFIVLLKEAKLSDKVLKIITTMFDRIWDEEIKNSKKSESMLDRRKIEIESQIRDITSLILNSKSEYVRSSYENEIELLGKEMEEIESNNPIGSLDLEIPYRTALEKATGLLKSPYSIWVNLSTKEKQDLFYFIFPQKLAYSRKDGYRTDEIPSAVRLFECFTTSKPRLVEVAGIEPACKKKS